MPLFLSVPEALRQQGHPIEPSEAVRCPRQIPLVDVTGKSYGYRQRVYLRPGLDILIDDYTLQEDLIIETGDGRAYEPFLALELSFMLSSYNHGEGIESGHNFFYAGFYTPQVGQAHWQSGEHILKLDIHITRDSIEALIGQQLENLPPNLGQLIQNPQSGHRFRQVDRTTAAMQSAIHQILHCPYQGLTRWLYWESRVLELIALRLEQLYQPEQKAGLYSEDVDRIYYASDILLQRLDNPPSLLELSRLAGLNDYKLKQGFRQIFGTTVFGYLQTHRMERAKQLLANPTFNILGVAQASGYTSQSHFCHMFKKQFGMTPRHYRNNLRH